jgi:hypothetical protein
MLKYPLFSVGTSVLVSQGPCVVVKRQDCRSHLPPWSKAQSANRRRFNEAMQYALQAMANPYVCAHYEMLGKKANRQPFRLAVSDYLRGIDLLKPIATP